MSSSSKNWPVPSSFEEYLGQLNRRISGQERRQGPLLLSENLGPGLAARSKELRDWNDPEARFNGFFYSEPGASNTPDETKAWTGNVIARDNGSGMQQVWNTGNTEGTLYYIRTYTPISLADERVTFTEWKRFATESGLIDIEDLTPTVNFNIDTALADAAEAFEFAVASNSTFRQPTAPVSDETYTLREGDIWFDTDDQNRTYYWSGSAWADTRDAGIAAAEAAALQGQQDAADALDAAEAALTVGSAGESRIVNGGAEADLTGWTVEGAGIYTVTAKARTGLKSFRTDGGGSFRQDAIPVTVGDRWRFEWWYQSAGTGSPGGLRLQASNDGGATFPISAASTEVAASQANWTYQKVEYTVPAGVTHIRARIAFAYAGGAAVWFDDVALINITRTGNLIQTTDLAARGVKIDNSGIVGYDGVGNPKFVLNASTGQITSMDVTAGTITGALVQTNTGLTTGVKITSTGLFAYNGSGVQTFGLSASTGNLTLTGGVTAALNIDGAIVTGGTLQTSTGSTTGVKINSTGLVGYGGGIAKFVLNASTGQITSVDIIAGTITGALIRTSTSSSRVEMTSSGIYAYSGGSETFRITTAGGNGTFAGSVNGTNVTATDQLTAGAGNSYTRIDNFGGISVVSSGTSKGSISASTGTFSISGINGELYLNSTSNQVRSLVNFRSQGVINTDQSFQVGGTNVINVNGYFTGPGIIKNSTAAGTIASNGQATGSISHSFGTGVAVALTAEGSGGKLIAQITSITSSSVNWKIENVGGASATGCRMHYILMG